MQHVYLIEIKQLFIFYQCLYLETQETWYKLDEWLFDQLKDLGGFRKLLHRLVSFWKGV
jgi:hypothetical protein